MPAVFLFKNVPVDLNERYETPAEKRVQGDPTGAKSTEGGPPAESECLEWKST
ncbi:hypothetical protein KEH51_20350 [[Brevibacterium] frigoritolerans]|uniref:Uncharacterized protein n=1 Tax=Peribacillus frigoritolerans TaxID=450367 RepID=A0A941JBA7_9BACI|nr:hypothetical protein [Peribacillus frigoritolerans]